MPLAVRLAHLVGQGLQDLQFDDVAQSFLLLRHDLQGFQKCKGFFGPLLGQQNASSCHVLAFTGKWRCHSVLLREFLRPVSGAIQRATGQPELHPLHYEEGIEPVLAVCLCQGLFCVLEGNARCLQLSSCQVDAHQYRISKI